MLIDYEAHEEFITPQIKAIIPVLIFGNPLNNDHLRRIEEKHIINIAEDSVFSVFAKYEGKFLGNLVDISVFCLLTSSDIYNNR